MLSDKHILLGLAFFWFIGQGGSKPAKRKASPAWTDEEMLIFDGHVKATGVPTEVALLVYTLESNLDPHASSGIAWGLPQMTRDTLYNIDWSETGADFGKLSVADQAPWIEKLLRYQIAVLGGKPPTTALDLFVVNLWPQAALSKAQVVLDSNVPKQAAAYKANKGLDRSRPKKGYISRNDLASVLSELETSETYMRAIEQLRRIHGGT